MLTLRDGGMAVRVASVAVACVLCVCAGVRADVVTFQQGVNGYTGNGGANDRGDAEVNSYQQGGQALHQRNYGAKDTFMVNGSMNSIFYNYEMHNGMSVWKDFIGNAPGQVPSDAQITSATLRLYGEGIGGAEAGNLGVYSWLEPVYPGTLNGVLPTNSQDGDSTAMSTGAYRVFYSKGWNGPYGAWASAATDTTGTMWDSFAFNQDLTNTPLGWIEFDVTGAVQEWVDGTAPNYGFAFFTNTAWTGMIFHSAEYADSSLRPQLVVDYVPEPATVLLIALGSVLLRRRLG